MEAITPISVYRDHYTPGSPGKGRDHKYVPLKLGWIISSAMRAHSINERPGPSYARIGPINEITDLGISHTLEIRDYSVFLNGSLICQAPGNKTRAFKEKFCKAVIWGLMDNRDDLRDHLDKIEDKRILERAPDLMIPDPLPVPMYPVNEILGEGPISRPVFIGLPVRGPYWQKYGSVLIMEERIPGACA